MKAPFLPATIVLFLMGLMSLATGKVALGAAGLVGSALMLVLYVQRRRKDAEIARQKQAAIVSDGPSSPS